MDCAEMRNILYAFVDGELDVRKNLEATTHMAECAACRKMVEDERKFVARTAAALKKDAAPEGLREKILADLDAASPATIRAPRRHIRFFIRTAAVAAAILAAVIALYPVLNPEISIAREARLLYERYAEGGAPLHLATADAGKVAEYLKANLDVAAAIPQLDADGCKCTMQGVSLCEFKKMKSAMVVYRMGDKVLGLLVVPDDSLRCPKMVEISAKFRLSLGQCLKCKAIMWKDGGLSYIAVSNLDVDRLRELVEAYLARKAKTI